MSKEDLLEVEMIDDWCGLADRLWMMEEPMCELMRHVVNPVGWGLGHTVKPDISVCDRFWLGDRACTQCRPDGEGTRAFCSHCTRTMCHRSHCRK